MLYNLGREIVDQRSNRTEIVKELAEERVLLLGFPGSGKTTLADALCEKSDNFHYVSLGDISRRLPVDSSDALQLAELFKLGRPSGQVAFFLKLVDPHLRQHAGRGFILDGIPKTEEEIGPLFQYFHNVVESNISLVIHLEVSAQEALGRISLRGMQDSRDKMMMYQERIASYDAAVEGVRKAVSDTGIPWLSVKTDNIHAREVVDTLLDQYEDTRLIEKATAVGKICE